MFTILSIAAITAGFTPRPLNADTGSKSGCVCPSCKAYILTIAILGTATGILLIIVFVLLLVYHMSKADPIVPNCDMSSQCDTAPDVPDPESE